MSKRDTHQTREQMDAVLQHFTTMRTEERKALLNVIDLFTFQMLDELLAAINVIRKGADTKVNWTCPKCFEIIPIDVQLLPNIKGCAACEAKQSTPEELFAKNRK